MGVQGGTLENPNCVGDAERPDPAPGYLCIYPNDPELVNVAKTGEGLLSAEPHPIFNGRRGFKLIWSAQAPGSTPAVRGLGVPCALKLSPTGRWPQRPPRRRPTLQCARSREARRWICRLPRIRAQSLKQGVSDFEHCLPR